MPSELTTPIHISQILHAALLNPQHYNNSEILEILKFYKKTNKVIYFFVFILLIFFNI